jgi:hypothetical protein
MRGAKTGSHTRTVRDGMDQSSDVSGLWAELGIWCDAPEELI